jgi:hypothetical protein
LGRQRPMAELLRDDLEVAVPARDPGCTPDRLRRPEPTGRQLLGAASPDEGVHRQRFQRGTEVHAHRRSAAGPRLVLGRGSEGRLATSTLLLPEQVLRFLNLVASRIPAVLNSSRPALQAELPLELFRNARLQGFVPPLAAAPVFNLRKPPAVVYTLDQYVEAGILSPATAPPSPPPSAPAATSSSPAAPPAARPPWSTPSSTRSPPPAPATASSSSRTPSSSSAPPATTSPCAPPTASASATW